MLPFPTKDVHEYALVHGNPAKQQGGSCESGVKLDEEPTCPECGAKYNKVESFLQKL